MKKVLVFVCLGGTLFSTAVFGQMQVTLLQDTDNYSEWIGGEFRAVAGGTPNLGAAVNQSAYFAGTSGFLSGQFYFQTFCLEFNEDFNPGSTYNVTIGPNALYGSLPPAGDPVSIGTAWLYSQFAAGSLVGLTAGNVAVGYDYTYGSGRLSSAGQLQQAIWWLEDEPVGDADPGNSNIFRNAVLAQFGSAANAMVDANGAYGVMALNLGEPGAVQDQLVIVPGDTLAPEPTSAALLLVGSLLIPVVRRKIVARS